MSSEANARDRATRRQSRRSQRIRTACLRCQQRKIRCDAALPTCASCEKSSKECEYQDGSLIDHQARAYVRHPFCTYHLEHRVSWLETIVKDRCPDVDLAHESDTGGSVMQVTSIPASNDVAPHISNGRHELDLELDSQDIPQDTSMATHETRASGVEAPRGDSNNMDSSIAHQIGLVSLPNGDDPRYIGPSSGHFFTQLICTASALTRNTSSIRLGRGNVTLQQDSSLAEKLLRDVQTPLPSSKDLTRELTMNYFKTIHQHLPFLHEPTHLDLIEDMYASTDLDPVVAFQVYMVLALSSIMLSRRDRAVLPSEGWYAKAMSFFKETPLESSTRGLQCLLLLYVWGMHSPTTKLNIWYLNYQCIAMVVDLGLQRDITSSMSIPPLKQEMRTRLFWVVYSLDRSLCTMMGRPIGLRDEACDLRLPADVSDTDLSSTSMAQISSGGSPSHMSCAIHMFKLAKLNSEMKYILHSISRDTPTYAYPAIRCMQTWQRDMASRLDQWAADMPQTPGLRDYVTKLCDIRYHVLKTLLLRPSPGIPHPDSECLKGCYKSAMAAVRLYHELYVDNLLAFSWTSYHSIMMSTVTIFFCIWTCPTVIQDARVDELVSDLRAASNILSATGEHWPGAKRSRDILDELSHRTISWIMDRRSRSGGDTNPGLDTMSSDMNNSGLNAPFIAAAHAHSADLEALMQQYSRNWTPGLDLPLSGFDSTSDSSTGLWTGDVNTDTFLQDLFDGLAPMSF
ncbi:hypothetical protein E4T39_03057 [Aureobasidium subglaciale]|nr:hypothetical protein E4T39_03057 [Aureobasidium subglaciale]